jgi:putative addiction module component (TIGR02574 family)
MSREDLLAQVLQLSREDRALVAEELLSSLEEPDEDAVAEAWASELERRSREMAEGKAQTVEWAVARTQILAELGRVRFGLGTGGAQRRSTPSFSPRRSRRSHGDHGIY